MGKTATIYVIDTSPSMAETCTQVETSEPQSKLAVALDCTRRMVHQKAIAGRKSDNIGVVLFGSDETDNPLADEDSYQNITVFEPMEQPRLELLKRLRDIKPSKIEGDVISGLIVAVETMSSFCRHLKFEKKIYVITDAASPIDEHGIEEIAETIKSKEIEISIIGMDFTDEDDEEGTAEETVKSKNEVFLRKFTRELLQGTNSDVFTMEDAYAQLSELHKKAVGEVTIFRGDLTFGKEFAIPVYVYNRTSEMKLPTAKRCRAYEDPVDKKIKVKNLKRDMEYRTVLNDDDIAVVEAAEPAKPEGSLTEDTSKPDKIYGDIVSKDDVNRNYNYGTSLVPVSEEVESLMSAEEKGMAVIGAVPVMQLPRRMFLSNTMTVIAPPDNPAVDANFNTLVHALIDTQHVLLVRYCKNEKSSPKIAALIPQLKEGKYQCLQYVQLPFADDVREHTFYLPVNMNEDSRKRMGKVLAKMAPVEEQEQVAADFIDSLDLTTCVKDEDGENVEVFKPRHTFNPMYHRMYQCIEHRALFPEADIPPPTTNILKQTADVPGLIDPEKQALKKFKETLPLEVVPPKPSKKKRMDVATVQFDTLGDLLAKEDMLKRKAERKKIVADIQAKARDPLDAFESMIYYKDEDLTTEALTCLCNAVFHTLEKGPSGNGAALSYLRTLRTNCVEYNEYSRFNELLKAVNEKYPTTFMPLLKSQGLTLISKMDADQCETSPEEARAFLDAIASADVDETETETEDDD